MECLKQLVQEGKIRYVGMSECTPSEFRRAHAVYPVTAIQMEYSLQSRDVDAEIIPTARELGVGIVAYSPLGRGFLSATFTALDQLAENDWRRTQPRFSEENFAKNVQTRFFEYAAKKKCTPAQLALAWVHAQGSDIFPIPGTKDPSRLEENLGALNITLSPEEAKEVGDLVEVGTGDPGPESQGAWLVLPDVSALVRRLRSKTKVLEDSEREEVVPVEDFGMEDDDDHDSQWSDELEEMENEEGEEDHEGTNVKRSFRSPEKLKGSSGNGGPVAKARSAPPSDSKRKKVRTVIPAASKRLKKAAAVNITDVDELNVINFGGNNRVPIQPKEVFTPDVRRSHHMHIPRLEPDDSTGNTL